MQVWDAVNECFDVMPIAATVDDRVSLSPTSPYWELNVKIVMFLLVTLTRSVLYHTVPSRPCSPELHTVSGLKYFIYTPSEGRESSVHK